MTFSISRLLCAAAAMGLAGAAMAAPITVSFTYTGAGTFVSGETASGSGSFTYNGSTLTAFSFTDTLTETLTPFASATFTYGLADVASDSINPGSGFSQLVINLSTNQLSGNPSSFGTSAFTLQYSAANPGAGSTAGSSGATLQDFTGGTVTLTQGEAPPATPEPATIGLAGVALSMGAIFLRRRRSC
jgi:PEP-CTERM motif-containing protein